VAASITSLLKGGPVRLQWSAEEDRAFNHLRTLFTSAPVLAYPEPTLGIHSGSGRIRGWDRSRALSALGHTTGAPPLCFLLEETQPGGAEL
jgi:hypothetical protein